MACLLGQPPFQCACKGAQGKRKMIFECVDAVEDTVVESLFAQLVPHVLHRIELRCVRRQAQQADVRWRAQLAAGVPAGTIKHHDDALSRMALAHLVQEQLHAVRVDVRQDERVQLAAGHIDGGIRVGLLVGQHGLAQGAKRLGCPAAAHIVDASKARLVLEHQLDGALPRPLRADFGKVFGEFFFHSS